MKKTINVDNIQVLCDISIGQKMTENSLKANREMMWNQIGVVDEKLEAYDDEMDKKLRELMLKGREDDETKSIRQKLFEKRDEIMYERKELLKIEADMGKLRIGDEIPVDKINGIYSIHIGDKLNIDDNGQIILEDGNVSEIRAFND